MTVKPELRGSLDKAEYLEGDIATVTLTENIPGPTIKLIYDARDNFGRDWTVKSQSTDGAVLMSPPLTTAGDLLVTAKVTRTFDGATATTILHAVVKTIPVVTRVGVSMSDEDHPDVDSGPEGGLSGVGVNWLSAHCYNTGDVAESAVYKVESVQFSDSALWSASGRADVSRIRTSLSTILANRPELKRIEYSWGNEVDRHVTDFSLFEQNVHDIGAMIDAAFGEKVMMGVSFTGNCFRLPLSGPPFKIEPFKAMIRRELARPDRFVAANLYPQGRDDTPEATKTPTSLFVDPVLNTLAALGVKNFACWEIGTPLSPNYDRPAYMKEARDATLAVAKRLGITVLAFDYWDQDIGIDNRLFHDWPKTAQAFTRFP